MLENYIGLILDGRYEIRAPLGSGGMSVVFVARDRRLDRRVAVKFIKPEHAWSSDAVEAFIRETGIIASLQHPHILTVYDCGAQAAGGQELTYLVMDLASGGTLLERIRRQPLTLNEADRILGQVCSALDYAHDHKVIHLDLKPANILLDEQGNALVADFGLARLLRTTFHVTPETVAGTPPYMPFEQWQGKSAGRLSDVYALGITLYEALTGELPERELTEQGLFVHLRHPLSPSIQAVIEQATHPDPNRRYQRAGDLAQAFTEAAASSIPVPTWPETEVRDPELTPQPLENLQETPPPGRSPPPKRSWILRVSAGLAAVAIIAGFILLGQRWLEEQMKRMLVVLPLTLTPPSTATTTSTATLSFSPTPPPSPTITLTPTPASIPYLIVSTERLRVHAGPDENHKIVGEVNGGDRLSLCGRLADGTWWQVDYLGKKGWVLAQPVGASIDPTDLPVVKAPPSPTRIPTPTTGVTPTLPADTEIPLQNPGLDDAYGDSIPGWQSWALDNWAPDVESPPDPYDTPVFGQTHDPMRMINGPTFQIEATAFVKFKVHIYQIVSVQPDIVVRFQALARAYTSLDGNRIKLAAGVDPNGGSDCSKALWGEELLVTESDGIVRLISSDAPAGDAGQVTVCLYAEPLYPARSNAAFLDDAILIANPGSTR